MTGTAIDWYRVPVDKDTMQRLNTRSDLRGLLQTLGFLALITLTAATAVYSAAHWPWPLTLLIVFTHGTFFAFMLNGFHELCHQSVFRSRRLNTLFLWIFSFIGWYNHVKFINSHMRHHRYTLFPPDDMENVLPLRFSVKSFFASGFIHVAGFRAVMGEFLRHASGRLTADRWENMIYPESDPVARRQLFNWSRFTLAGHVAIVAVSLHYGQWMIPVVTTFARFYGEWLMYLCNNTQHVGLQDNVPDFRLCARTIHINPFLRFLYWHMNYHIEHHMYAAVPCYNLRKLHLLLKPDLPPTPNGLAAAWREIAAIMHRQDADPKYQYIPPCPEPRILS